MTLDGQTEKDLFFAQFPVSHETKVKIERYAELLVEWNEKFNLIAASTVPHIWARHFQDSAQLFALLPKGAHCLVDMGSGAGFPGLLLALMGVPEVHLIESIGKKAGFLKAVAGELAPHVTVHQARIESVRDVRADVVTARALTALPILLSLAKPFLGKDGVCVFPKGEKADVELTEASKYWTFSVKKKESVSDPSGTILCLRDLKVRHDPKRKTSRS